MAKLDAVIAAADIKPTDHVLEIGCGWGSFAMRAASSTGCRYDLSTTGHIADSFLLHALLGAIFCRSATACGI